MTIAQEIIQMAEEDQKMRFESQEGKREFDKNIDIRNYQRLKEIIKELNGWPTIDLVGEEASYAAWIIAQHADYEPEFQKECLNLILKNPDGVLKSNIAYLTDRVAVNLGKPQIYGTQFYVDTNGKLIFRPIKDEENVEERRKQMGLEPLELLRKKISGEYNWPEGYENPKIGRFIKSL